LTLQGNPKGENMNFSNCYEDNTLAEAYAKLEFPGTYYLAYRDIPKLIEKFVKGKSALDFGCGTGRSTRFLEKYGLSVTGIDISPDMLAKAEEADNSGEYILVNDGNFQPLESRRFDLIQSVFTFDNTPTYEQKLKNLSGLTPMLGEGGVMINLVSRPEIYIHEWASFSTKDFPENKKAKSGDRVKIIITAISDSRPVTDVVWDDPSYRDLFAKAGLEVIASHAPLGQRSEPFAWINETQIAPWQIYVLKRKQD